MATPGPQTSNSKVWTNEQDEKQLLPYIISGHLGNGSFATVYRGANQDTHEAVAIKTVTRDKLSESAKLWDNLKSEIQILKSLSHRHITKLIDIVRAEHHIYLIMEFCAGGDLTQYIKKRGKVPGLEYVPGPGRAPQYYPHPPSGGLNEIVVRSFLRQLARALKFLRQRNLIHRDIKPQNLLLNPASEQELARGHPLGVPILKVADFGFARSLPNAMMAETLCGSPLYMAPEILDYQKYDAKADLWSVGAVLYEMSVGRPPFRAVNHIELSRKIRESKGIKFPDEDPKSSTGRNGGGGSETHPVPDDVKTLIRMLLKRSPVERASFEDFFGSTALAKSKFTRPEPSTVAPGTSMATSPSAENPESPEVLDPDIVTPPSKFNFRRPSEAGSPSHGRPTIALGPQSPTAARPLRPLSTEQSIIPGETEEDGLLRREYVLVGDTRALEFNRAIDEIDAARRRPLRDKKIVPTDDVHSQEFLAEIDPNTAFPPPPLPRLSSSPSSVASRAASNALNRALSIASKKLWGTSQRPPSSGTMASSQPSSPVAMTSRRPQIIALDASGERDPLEDELLAALEELAQKTDVLTTWADEMYEFVKAVPQKPLPDPTRTERRDDENEKQARRRQRAEVEAEYNAVTCVAVYLLLMSFSQKGIDMLRNHQEHMQMRHPENDFVVSEGFDDALNWFKDHFVKCNDRAALVKTWLPAKYEGPKGWIDQLVYDRALALSRMAARKELTDQANSPEECEKLYEESLWCLYALQDDLLQTGNPFLEEDRETIASWIKRIKQRLVRCRARKHMEHRERINDARADENLADVARVTVT
ncbi:other/ULK/ULK protein kinase [Fistulina hepatica ATCC 64428]|uniref:non-specific serine/threonine protein kinase n=1 Tax=Fistulina hepatica ATCC 64428 TaxID=1128425 RepID=A0A0D7AR81_9AGAR|nr:other/ULK/ULK protein kinase [Fistulina hepatica ATCC 64428]